MHASALRRRPSSASDPHDEFRIESSLVARLAAALRHQEMPSEEIRAVLTADEPELVRRYLELHRERLEERLADQRRTLAALEQLLAERAAERRRIRTKDTPR